MSLRNIYRIGDKIGKIRLIIIDVDGVLSNGKAYMIGDGKKSEYSMLEMVQE